MRPQKFVLLLTTLIASFAFAKSTNEYFFQPADGKNKLDLFYEMANAKVDFEGGGNSKLTISDFHVDYAYGLNANNALGVHTFSGTSKSKLSTGTTTTADGMGDLHVYYKGFMDMWHYGADLGISTAKEKSDNRATGGHSIALYGGGLWTNGAWNFGPKLTYTIFMERTDDSSPEVKTTGGNVLNVAGFAEYGFGEGFIGGELAFISEDKSTLKQSGASTSVKGNTATSIAAYATYSFNETVDGIFKVTDYMVAKNSDTGIKAYSLMMIDLGVRINF